MKNSTNNNSGYKKVLIVDDYDLTCNMAAMYFATFGYQADSAASAKDGLELALANDYEIMLVDLCLPDYSGLKLVKQLRSHESLTKLKIIIFTGNDGETINYYRQYGVDALLLKPCTLAKVREVVDSCLIAPREMQAAFV
jgi:two-component system response regulator ResD